MADEPINAQVQAMLDQIIAETQATAAAHIVNPNPTLYMPTTATNTISWNSSNTISLSENLHADYYIKPQPKARRISSWRADQPGAEKAMIKDADAVCARLSCGLPLKNHVVSVPGSGLRSGLFPGWKGVSCPDRSMYTICRDNFETGRRDIVDDLVACGVCMKCSYEGTENEMAVRSFIDQISNDEQIRVSRLQANGEPVSWNGWEESGERNLVCLFCGYADTNTTQEEMAS